MNKRNNMVMGIIFIVLGVLFLLKNVGILNFSFDIFDIGFIASNFWPSLFLILPGIAMHTKFFSGRNTDPGILVPGGILLTAGITCQLATSFSIWHLMWPGFILAVAIGLFELYVFGTKEKGLLVPVTILGSTSIFFFMSYSLKWVFGIQLKQLFIPLLLILLGLLIIFKSGRSKGRGV